METRLSGHSAYHTQYRIVWITNPKILISILCCERIGQTSWAGINCGYTGKGFQSVIPSNASAKLDLHFVSDQKPEKCLSLIKKHIKRNFPEEQVKYIQGGSMYPSKTSISHPAVSLIKKCLEKVWNKNVVI